MKGNMKWGWKMKNEMYSNYSKLRGNMGKEHGNRMSLILLEISCSLQNKREHDVPCVPRGISNYFKCFTRMNGHSCSLPMFPFNMLKSLGKRPCSFFTIYKYIYGYVFNHTPYISGRDLEGHHLEIEK